MDNKLEEALLRIADCEDLPIGNANRLVIREAADEITRLNAENERLREAGKPFGDMTFGGTIWESALDDAIVLIDHRGSVITRGDFRKLRALITKASRDSGHETRT